MHPAVPRQQALKDIPHYHDYGDPQARAHQNASNYLLAVRGHVSTVDRDIEREGETKGQTRRGVNIRVANFFIFLFKVWEI